MRQPYDSPAEAIEALVCGYAPHDWQNKYMVVLRAFIDDSAADVGDKRLFLAGYIGSANHWIAFSHRWHIALREHPSIDYFSMADANALRGQFEGWNEADRDFKVYRLASVIGAAQLSSIECSISRTDYNTLIAPNVPRGMRHPYFVCFYGVVITVARSLIGIPEAPPIDFVFDEQGPIGAEAVFMYEWIKASSDPEISARMGSTPIFSDDKKVLPLQAADMLAWHLRREHEGSSFPSGEHVLDALRRDGRHLIAKFDRATLAEMSQKLATVPKDLLVQDAKEWRKFQQIWGDLLVSGISPDTLAARKNSLQRIREFFVRLFQF